MFKTLPMTYPNLVYKKEEIGRWRTKFCGYNPSHPLSFLLSEEEINQQTFTILIKNGEVGVVGIPTTFLWALFFLAINQWSI